MNPTRAPGPALTRTVLRKATLADIPQLDALIALRWLVIAVIAYAAFAMLRSAARAEG